METNFNFLRKLGTSFPDSTIRLIFTERVRDSGYFVHCRIYVLRGCERPRPFRLNPCTGLTWPSRRTRRRGLRFQWVPKARQTHCPQSTERTHSTMCAEGRTRRPSHEIATALEIPASHLRILYIHTDITYVGACSQIHVVLILGAICCRGSARFIHENPHFRALKTDGILCLPLYLSNDLYLFIADIFACV